MDLYVYVLHSLVVPFFQFFTSRLYATTNFRDNKAFASTYRIIIDVCACTMFQNDLPKYEATIICDLCSLYGTVMQYRPKYVIEKIVSPERWTFACWSALNKAMNKSFLSDDVKYGFGTRQMKNYVPVPSHVKRSK